MNAADQPRPGEGRNGPPAEAEQILQALVEGYLERLQAGEEPDPCDLILAHPHFAGELEARLETAEMLFRLARRQSPASSDTVRQSEDPGLPGLPVPGCLGRYRVERVLGQGSSGVVYQAYDPKFDRPVALKVFRPGPSGPELSERFQRDARIAAQLRHPNIVPLHDTGECDGLHYIDMELIAGESLEERLRRQPDRPLSPREAAVLVHKTAAALHYAHQAGIVHRDVKPSNLLLDAHGEPQVTDFGLARRAGGDESLTVEGQLLGTPAYMSPEQAEGRSHEADARSDVYSLGVVFYRLLTGRLPFGKSNTLASLLLKILKTDPPRPRELNPAVPADLEMICLKALEKDPADRFASARALADELWRWLQDEPLRIRPPTRWERLRRWGRRNRASARILVGASLVLLAVSTALGWLAYEGHLGELAAEAEADQARLRQTLEAQARREGEAWAGLDRARQRLRLPTDGRRRETVEQLRKVAALCRQLPPGPVVDRLRLEVRSVFAAAQGVPEIRVDPLQARLPDYPFITWPVAPHPDGQALAVGLPDRPVLWRRGRPLEVHPAPDPRAPRPRLAYSPNGKFLVFAPGKGGLQIWDEKADRRVKALEAESAGEVLAIGIAPGGKQLQVCHADGRVCSWDLPEYSPRPSWQVDLKPATAARFSEDAGLLAVGDAGGQVALYRAGGSFLRSLPGERLEVESLAWAPNNRLVAVGTKDGNLQVWDSNGTRLHQVPAFGVGVSRIQFSPDSRWVLAGERTFGLGLWDVATGRKLLTGPHAPGPFFPTGWQFGGENTARVAFCELLVPRAVRRLTGHEAALIQLAWSGDGRRLASLDTRFEVRIWDLERSVAVNSFRLPPGEFYAQNAGLALSEDGRLLAYASGGESGSQVLIREVATGKELGRWRLPGAFERLFCPKGNGFRLIREELDDRKINVQTTLWEVAPGQPPRRVRVVRPSEPGDRRRFLSSGLTPDGRFYWWVGPRDPQNARRVEVREVATGKLLYHFQPPNQVGYGDASAVLSPDGTRLWTQFDWGGQRHDLKTNRTERVPFTPVVLAPDGRWRVLDKPREQPHYLLFPGDRTEALIQLTNTDSSNPLGICFSPDGRYLAWGSQEGEVIVIDLPALRRQLRQFEDSAGSR